MKSASGRHHTNRQANLGRVLELVNQGRRAMGLNPIRRLPKGLIDAPRLSPVALALEAGVYFDQDNGNLCSSAEELRKLGYDLDQPLFLFSFSAPKLRRAWGTKPRNYEPQRSITAFLPAELSLFNNEFMTGLWPEFVDRDWIKLDEAAKHFGLSQDSLTVVMFRGGLSSAGFIDDNLDIEITLIKRSALESALKKCGHQISRASSRDSYRREAGRGMNPVVNEAL
jgi:hypothetical protein